MGVRFATLASLSLSLVDTARRHELLHLRADGLSLSFMSSALEHDAQLTIERIQLDNQLPRAVHPVLLRGTSLARTGAEQWLPDAEAKAVLAAYLASR